MPTSAAFFNPPPPDPRYRVYAEFQSHEPEFDYLKSLDIEEKINQVCSLPFLSPLPHPLPPSPRSGPHR